MDKHKHTPGPWVWQPSDEYGYSALWNPDTRTEVVTTSGRNDGDNPITWMGEEMSEADALLIAAAPDLLAALRAMILNDSHKYRDCYKAACAAVAKATGESAA